jgi:hypothetical protein
MPTPTDHDDLAILRHRLTEAEKHTRVIYEVRDAVRDLTIEVRLSKSTPCPAPGACLKIEPRVGALERSYAQARGIVIGLSVLGLANLAGLLLQIIKP